MKILKIIGICCILFLVYFFPLQKANSAQIICYSGGKEIYKGTGKDIYYGDKFLSFHTKNKKDYIFASGDCIIIMSKSELNYELSHQ